MRLLYAALIATIALGPSQARLPGPPPPQRLSEITDADSYEVYAAVLFGSAWDSRWKSLFKDTLVLRQETERWSGADRWCDISAIADNPEWVAVQRDLIRKNADVHLLKPLFPADQPYRFISQAAIEADDARLALKYPGQWQSRPESIEYAVVSAVGFDWSRTKAIVYVASRSSGGVIPLEFRDGKWVYWSNSLGCGGWIA